MVDRVRINRVNDEKDAKSEKRRSNLGGRRAGSGRKFGSVNAAKRVARARAALTDELPHELLLRWARTGRMAYPSGRTVELDPSDRITCAKGCAAWYKPAMQPRPAPGEQPPVLKIELDEKMLAALARSSPDKLDVLRDVLRVIQAGGGDLSQVAEGSLPGQADAARYGRMLSESSDVAGNA